MTGLEQMIVKTCNATDAALGVPSLGVVFMESERLAEIERQEEQFRQMQERTRRRRMWHLGCE